MNTEDLNEYIKENSRAYNIFIEKARVYQNTKNARRSLKDRYSQDKVEKEAQTMWENIIVDLHGKLNAESSLKKKAPIYWVNFILEHDILDEFEDSMGALELED